MTWTETIFYCSYPARAESKVTNWCISVMDLGSHLKSFGKVMIICIVQTMKVLTTTSSWLSTPFWLETGIFSIRLMTAFFTCIKIFDTASPGRSYIVVECPLKVVFILCCRLITIIKLITSGNKTLCSGILIVGRATCFKVSTSLLLLCCLFDKFRRCRRGGRSGYQSFEMVAACQSPFSRIYMAAIGLLGMHC